MRSSVPSLLRVCRNNAVRCGDSCKSWPFPGRVSALKAPSDLDLVAVEVACGAVQLVVVGVVLVEQCIVAFRDRILTDADEAVGETVPIRSGRGVLL